MDNYKIKRLGFTLIELLSVLVILSIISLIAIPVVIGLINSSNEKAIQVSVKNVRYGINVYFTKNSLELNKISQVKIECKDSKCYITELLDKNNNDIEIKDSSLEIDGQMPKSEFKIHISKNLDVESLVYYDGYCVKNENYNEKQKMDESFCSFETSEKCFEINKNGVLTKYKCDGTNGYPKITDIVIPKGVSLDGTYYDIKKINPFTFNDKDLTSVDLSEATELVEFSMQWGLGSFSNNSTLTSITFGNLPKLKTITTNAFTGCKISGNLDLSGLTGLEEIGAGAFSGNNISSITFGNLENLRIIGANAFTSCPLNGEVLDLSGLANLEEIGNAAFLKTKLSNVIFPKSIEKIGNEAFQDCNLVGDLDLSALTSLTTIGNFAFYANDIYTVTVPESIVSIDRFAFARATFNRNSNIHLYKVINLSNSSINWARVFSNNWTNYIGYDENGNESELFVTGKAVNGKTEIYVVSE